MLSYVACRFFSCEDFHGPRFASGGTERVVLQFQNVYYDLVSFGVFRRLDEVQRLLNLGSHEMIPGDACGIVIQNVMIFFYIEIITL
jgi:hypothetical protein